MREMTSALARPLPANIIQQAATASTPDFNLDVIRESAKAPHASNFVHVTPGFGFNLINNKSRVVVWLRLGFCALLGHNRCEINPALDPLGLHRLGSWNATPANTRLYDKMVSVIAKTALAVDPRTFKVVHERCLADTEGSKKRPNGVALYLKDGRVLVNSTVASPFIAGCKTK